MAPKISLPIMEDKRPIRSRSFSLRRHRPLLIVSVIIFALYYLEIIGQAPGLCGVWTPSSSSRVKSKSPAVKYAAPTPLSTKPAAEDARADLVPLEAHIMSKCPDARDCLRDLVLPAMMRVSDSVNFTLSYIGTPTENDGVDCKHGPAECMGNIIELCAAHLYPDPKIYLGFTMCLTRDYKDIPQRSLVESCALEHGMDFEGLNNCATQDVGGFGIHILRKSIQRSSEVRRFDDVYLKVYSLTRTPPGRSDEELHCTIEQRILLHKGRRRMEGLPERPGSQ